MINFNNPKTRRKISAIICIVLIIAMVATTALAVIY